MPLKKKNEIKRGGKLAQRFIMWCERGGCKQEQPMMQRNFIELLNRINV